MVYHQVDIFDSLIFFLVKYDIFVIACHITAFKLLQLMIKSCHIL